MKTNTIKLLLMIVTGLIVGLLVSSSLGVKIVGKVVENINDCEKNRKEECLIKIIGEDNIAYKIDYSYCDWTEKRQPRGYVHPEVYRAQRDDRVVVKAGKFYENTLKICPGWVPVLYLKKL